MSKKKRTTSSTTTNTNKDCIKVKKTTNKRSTTPTTPTTTPTTTNTIEPPSSNEIVIVPIATVKEEFDPYSFCTSNEFVIDITTNSNNENNENNNSNSNEVIDMVDNNQELKFQGIEIKVQRHHIADLGKTPRQMQYEKKNNYREIIFTPKILMLPVEKASEVLNIGTSTCHRLFVKALMQVPHLASILSNLPKGTKLWPHRSIKDNPFFQYALSNNGIKTTHRLYNSRHSDSIQTHTQ